MNTDHTKAITVSGNKKKTVQNTEHNQENYTMSRSGQISRKL